MVLQSLLRYYLFTLTKENTMKRFESKFVKTCLSEIEAASAQRKCITYDNLCKAVAATQATNGETDAINPDDDDDQNYVKLCVKMALVKPGHVQVVIGVGGGLILAGVDPDRKGTTRAQETVDAETVQRVLECIQNFLPKHPKGIATSYVAGALMEDPTRVTAAVSQLSDQFVIRRPNGIVTVAFAAEQDAKALAKAAQKSAATPEAPTAG
jgi:hypothetical protein